MSLLQLVAGALSTLRVSITDLIVTDTTSGVTATASYELTNAGVVNFITSAGGTSAVALWITPPSAAGSAYEVRVLNSGDALSSGTEGVWLALNTTRTWACSRGGPAGIVESVLNVEIRRASDSTVLSSATVTLHAEKT